MKKTTDKDEQVVVNSIIREAKYLRSVILSLGHLGETTYVSRDTGEIVSEEE